MNFKRVSIVFFFIITFMVAAPHAFAGSCSSNGVGTSWFVGANWTGTCSGLAGAPGVNDNVTVTAGHPITFDVGHGNPFFTGTITLNDVLDNTAGFSPTATNIVINSGGNYIAGSSTLHLNGTSGTLFTLNSGGTFTYGTSTVDFNGNGDATLVGGSGSPTFYNLTSSGTGTKTQGGAITFATGGTLSVTGGTYSAAATPSITASGSNTLSVTNATVTAPTAFEVDYPFATRTLSIGSTVDYNEGSPQTIYQGITYYNLKISGSFTKSLSGTTTVTNSVIPTSATFDTAGYTLNAGRIDMEGGIFTPGSSTVNVTGTSGTLINIGSGTLTPGTSTFNLSGNGDATVIAGGQSFYNLTSSGTGTKSMGSGLFGITAGGTFSVTNGTFDAGTSSSSANASGTTLSVTNATLKVGGTVFTNNFSGFATTTFGTGSTINYSLAGDQTIDSTKTYNNLTLSGSGTKSLGGATTATGVFSILGSASFTTTGSNYGLSVGSIVLNMAGSFIPNASTINVTGTGGPLLTLTAATLGWGTSTFNFTGNGDALIEPLGTHAPWSFYNLILSGTGAKTAGSDIYIEGGSLSVTNGTFDPGTYGVQNIVGTAALSVSGSGTLDVGGATFTSNYSGFATPTFGSGSTVNYYGTGTQTILNSTPYYNLTISGPAREVDFPTTGTTTVTNAFTANGASAGSLLSLFSPTPGSQWTFVPSGTASVANVVVRDSACGAGAIPYISQAGLVDQGNNGPCWTAAAASSTPVRRGGGFLFIPNPTPIPKTAVAVPLPVVTAQVKNIFTRALALGATGTDVTALQKVLTKDADLVMPAGAEYGYYGRATQRALKAFQTKYAIAKSGTPGYGIFGPKTRAEADTLNN